MHEKKIFKKKKKVIEDLLNVRKLFYLKKKKKSIFLDLTGWASCQSGWAQAHRSSAPGCQQDQHS